MEKALTKKVEVVTQNIAENFIQQAIEKNMPVEAMEKLLSMRDTLKKEWARERFFESLSQFQAECPEIVKDKVVVGKDGKTIRYRYASLDTIVRTVKPLLQKYGFSYTFSTLFDPTAIVVTCLASHKDGWQEQASFRAVIEKDAYMSEIQKWGSAMTYAKRYAFCSVFGIISADEDTDAADMIEDTEDYKQDSETASSEKKPDLATEAQLKYINTLLEQHGYKDREKRLAVVSDALGRNVSSSKELTKAEAAKLIEKLREARDEDNK